jgi:hypothetical protein
LTARFHYHLQQNVEAGVKVGAKLARASALGTIACAGLGVGGEALAQATTQTQSSSSYSIYNYEYSGRRNDSYQIRITAGIADATDLYDQTFIYPVGNSVTQAGFAEASAPRGMSVGGRPAVVVFGAPTLIESYEEFLDSFTDVSINTLPPRFETTVQTTSGDAPGNVVYAGERGGCYESAASGSTNTAPFDGRFPGGCDNNEETLVDPGVVNTNTHTTAVFETIELAFTNEDYLNTEHWHVAGAFVLIGAGHVAARSEGLARGADFLDRLTTQTASDLGGADPFMSVADASGETAPRPRRRALRFWSQGYGGRAEHEGDDFTPAGEGSFSGAAAGLTFAPSRTWRVAVALDHSISEIEAGAEEADATLTLIGAQAAYAAGVWFANAAAAAGAGDVETVRGNAGLGGVSSAVYDLDVIALSTEAGRRFAFGSVQVSPLMGAEWVRAESGAFAETGGLALAGPPDSGERARGWLGFGLAQSWDWDNGASLRLSGRARALNLLSDKRQTRAATFIGAPSDQMEISGVTEDDTSADLQFDADLIVGRGFGLHVGLAGASGDHHESYRFAAGLRARW